MTQFLKCKIADWVTSLFSTIFLLLIEVAPIEKEIPKSIFLEQLEREAPSFINSIFNFDLPDSSGRLRIPVIDTSEKKVQQSINRSALDQFLNDEMYQIDGATEFFSDVSSRFKEWLGPMEAQNWTNIRISKELMRLKVVKGKHGTSGDVCIANYSFDKIEPTDRLGLNVKTNRLRSE